MQVTEISSTPAAGVFHFLQHRTVSLQDWQALCQTITKAYLKLCEHPETLGLATAPAICEYTGCRPLRHDNSVIGLDMIGFNGERVTHQAGDLFLLYRRQTLHALIRCDTRAVVGDDNAVTGEYLQSENLDDGIRCTTKTVALSRPLADSPLPVACLPALRFIAMKTTNEVTHTALNVSPA